MKAEEHLILLDQAKSQEQIGSVIGDALVDKDVTPEVYGAMCNTAVAKGFKFHNIKLS